MTRARISLSAGTRLSRRRRFARTAVALCLLPGCGEQPQPESYEVTERPGGRTVHFDLDSVTERYHVAPDPEWTAGEGVGTEILFESVRTARQLSDSVIAVVDGGSLIIHLITPSGKVTPFGGRGDGPSEFHSVWAMELVEPGLVTVYDAGRERILRFDGDGEFLGATSVREIVASPSLSSETYVPVDRDAYVFAVHVGLTGEEGMGAFRHEGPVLYVSDQGVDTIGHVPGPTLAIGAGGGGTVPFALSTSVARGIGGIWVGDQADTRVDFWPIAEGDSLRVTWSGGPDRAVTDERLNRVVEEIFATEPNLTEAMKADFWRYLESVPLPEESPAFSELLPDGAGGIWIAEYPGPTTQLGRRRRSEQRWYHVDRDGTPSGFVVTPEGLEPLEFGSDWVLGRFKDPMDIESVRRYRIVEGGGPDDADRAMRSPPPTTTRRGRD